MTHRVVYAPRTVRDLEKVHAYLANETKDRTVADRFISQLLAACANLETLPERFAVYPYARTWRMMPFGDYLVFFQVHANTTLIGHVRHAARRPFGG